jgi:hypothetical protein
MKNLAKNVLLCVSALSLSAPVMAAPSAAPEAGSSEDAAKRERENVGYKTFHFKVGEKIYIGKENLEAFQKDEKSLNVFIGAFIRDFIAGYSVSPQFVGHFDKKYGLGTAKKIDVPALTKEVTRIVVARPHKAKLRVGSSETIWLELMKLTVDQATKQLAIKAGLWKEPSPKDAKKAESKAAAAAQ